MFDMLLSMAALVGLRLILKKNKEKSLIYDREAFSYGLGGLM
jgi:hypothetical protein